jgi:hypothetical protein
LRAFEIAQQTPDLAHQSPKLCHLKPNHVPFGSKDGLSDDLSGYSGY